MLSKPRGALEREKLQAFLNDAVEYFITGVLDEAMWTVRTPPNEHPPATAC